MIRNLELKNYRNIESLSTDFNSGINIIVAPNGSGKTNILESIYFTSFNKVFRVMDSTKQLTLISKDFTRVTLELESQNVLEKQINSEGKISSFLNSKSTTSAKLAEKLPVILFAPSSVNLVDGDASVRRDDLDIFLSRIDAEYRISIIEYKKILKQRNALLKLIKEGKSNIDGLKFWDTKLIKLSKTLYSLRLRYIEELNNSSKEIDLERYTPVLLQYKEHFEIKNFDSKPDEYESILETKISTGRDKEVSAGKTLYGAHRDEISIFMDSIELRYLGSRGQQRIGAFIYKLTQHFLLKKYKDESPIFLIDDLMSELDSKNREICGRIIANNTTQAILTSADENEIDQQTKLIGNFIRITGN